MLPAIDLEDLIAIDEVHLEMILRGAIPPELLEEDGHVGRADIDSEGRPYAILLAQAILEVMGQPRPSPRHRVRHVNGDKLDNRRPNLTWHLPDARVEVGRKLV